MKEGKTLFEEEETILNEETVTVVTEEVRTEELVEEGAASSNESLALLCARSF